MPRGLTRTIVTETIPSPAAFLTLPVSFTRVANLALVTPDNGSGGPTCCGDAADVASGVAAGTSGLGDGSGVGVTSGVDSTLGWAGAGVGVASGVAEDASGLISEETAAATGATGDCVGVGSATAGVPTT